MGARSGNRQGARRTALQPDEHLTGHTHGAQRGTPSEVGARSQGGPHKEDMKEEREDFYMSTQRENIIK